MSRPFDRTGRSSHRHSLVTPGPAVCLILAAALLAAPSGATAGVELRYRFQPGTIYDQTINMTMTIDMKMDGVPEDQAAMANALTQEMTQEMVMKMAMELGAQGEDGAMPVEMRLEEMQSAMTVSGQRMATPMADVAGTKLMTGRMTAGGRMAEMQVQGMEGVSSDMIDRLLQFIPEMPEATLSVGDTFEVPVTMSLPIPGANMDMNGSSVYTLTSVSGREAAFDVAQKFSLGVEGEGGAEVAGMNMTLDGGGTGTAVFDLEEGIFSRIKVEMQMEATLQGTPPGATGGEPGAAPFNMKMSAGGPIEMTFTRRGAGS